MTDPDSQKAATTKEVMERLMALQPSLYAFLATTLSVEADVGGVLQEANVGVWKALEKKGAEIRSIDAFIWAVVRNKATDWIRKQLSSRLVVMDSEMVNAIADQWQATQITAESGSGDRQNALRHCVRNLSEREQEQLEMRYRDGYTVRELAKKLEKSEASLQQQLHRIRLRLRKCVESAMLDTA